MLLVKLISFFPSNGVLWIALSNQCFMSPRLPSIPSPSSQSLLSFFSIAKTFRIWVYFIQSWMKELNIYTHQPSVFLLLRRHRCRRFCFVVYCFCYYDGKFITYETKIYVIFVNIWYALVKYWECRWWFFQGLFCYVQNVDDAKKRLWK